jgi:acyl-CoA synthetase (AMP-forming)/AMP-acid ligase II
VAAPPSSLNLLLMSGVLEAGAFGTVRLVAHGAEPMPAPLRERLRRALPGAGFQERFGTSETGAVRVRDRGTGGGEFRIEDPGVEWRIEEGELVLRSPSRALGYLNADGGGRFLADGWYRTGDVVENLGEGWLRLVGRRSDVINVGGEKVFPATVERVLLEHPDVVDCAAHGVSNAVLGQVVGVDIVWRQRGATAMEVKRALESFAAGRLQRAERPVQVRIVEAVARTESGKVTRGTAQR